MNYSLEVCLVAITLATPITPSIAVQPSATAWEYSGHTADTPPALHRGISVEMPVTRNAVPVPDADQEDAMVVAITQDGHIYLRVDPITDAAPAARLKASRSNNADKKLYIKADARTLYAKVVNVLDAARAAGFESVTLLTSQTGPTQPGALVSPKGLEVRVGQRSHYGPAVAVVNVLRSGQQGPKLMINNKPIPWASLQTTLADVLQNQVRKVVLVSAEGTLPFSDVVKMTDACISTKADVVLVRNEAQ